jgi:CBS domain-containing protein
MENKQNLKVRDIMNEEVITLTGTSTVQEAAVLMRDNEIGSVIIVDSLDSTKPIGIITERDIMVNVTAENKSAETLCKDAMSSPIFTIPPKILLTDAMHQMSNKHIKRLIVVENQRMVGIISQSDILEIAPYMIEILQERTNILKEGYNAEYVEGFCQLCGNWSEFLGEFEGIYICEECKATRKSVEFEE